MSNYIVCMLTSEFCPFLVSPTEHCSMLTLARYKHKYVGLLIWIKNVYKCKSMFNMCGHGGWGAKLSGQSFFTNHSKMHHLWWKKNKKLKNVTVVTGALWNYRGEKQWQCSISWDCLWWLCLHKGWSSSRINIDLRPMSYLIVTK